ncbi:uncharacterized protein LOC121417416 [Lytechinus variegatus]|uniref:uncharacterized protein LOC121417416 n=1 Tax=Lytechinus variegatus TaxID=7654 RepID=UPI001BB1626F|nr:uncharacterized protein LOC121417416 [Lytechinus variegatus]
MVKAKHRNFVTNFALIFGVIYFFTNHVNCKTQRNTMELVKLIEVGEKFGFSGEELKTFVKSEQDRARDERAEQLELRRRERELAEIQLEVEREKRGSRESYDNEVSFADSGCVKARAPKLPPFNENRDDIDAYLQRYERYAKSQKWPESEWATNLSALLTGSALEVYCQLSSDDGGNFRILKTALLKRFHLTEEGFRFKFISEKPKAGETGQHYATRMENYLDRWIELAGIPKTYNDLRDLFLRAQYTEGCHRDLVTFLKERRPMTMNETTALVDRYLDARGGYFKTSPSQRQNPSSAGPSNKYEGKTTPSLNRSTNGKPKPCFNCHRTGHLARNCPKSLTCYLCHKSGHYANSCPQTTTKAAGMMITGTPNVEPYEHRWNPQDPEVPEQQTIQTEPGWLEDTQYVQWRPDNNEELKRNHIDH